MIKEEAIHPFFLNTSFAFFVALWELHSCSRFDVSARQVRSYFESKADKNIPYNYFERLPKDSVNMGTRSTSSIFATIGTICEECDFPFLIDSCLGWPLYVIQAHNTWKVALLNVVVPLYRSCRYFEIGLRSSWYCMMHTDHASASPCKTLEPASSVIYLGSLVKSVLASLARPWCNEHELPASSACTTHCNSPVFRSSFICADKYRKFPCDLRT